MSGGAKWDDLAPRLLAGLAMAVVGVADVVAGGIWIEALSIAVTGLMIWELAAMTAPDRPGEARLLGMIAALCLAGILWNHAPFAIALALVPPGIGALRPRRDRAVFFLYGFAVMMTGYGFVAFRGGLGLSFLLWVVAVVVASDVLGYFGGRIIGGAKFWPRVSPKKTWSGTVSGWIGAALVGAAFSAFVGAPSWLFALSALVAFAAQMGDIAESAIKRRAGVKDSSHLIPGHGGVLDRFDGLIGAVLFLILMGFVLPLPVIGG
ncbi:phosphatidate cytidylyltransferase [Defluviimonas sp. WL0002]|uniref:Phosphatidate cytidylyltransferase n=1 Tax=Albidovulum marisflavi TaxID=2984159 RepID=A0ABT2ZGD8_9RHOB|nr:phosphatidate cytidylyltransferase [Defluviimonas sp. WL0002]MCV2870082.1 phosphatidate cytidylyltransferase [Defluviimonas sp. WL0002]